MLKNPIMESKIIRECGNNIIKKYDSNGIDKA
jgi:hypothetical protein